MPDWTYEPLRGVAAAVAGRRRSQRAALHTLASAVSVPGIGRAVVWAFGLRPPPPHLAGSLAGRPVASRLGAVVPPDALIDAVRALPALGAGLIEVTPVGLADVPLVRQAALGRHVPLAVRTTEPEVAAAISPYVDAVLTGDEPSMIRLTDPSIASVAIRGTGQAGGGGCLSAPG